MKPGIDFTGSRGHGRVNGIAEMDFYAALLESSSLLVLFLLFIFCVCFFVARRCDAV